MIPLKISRLYTKIYLYFLVIIVFIALMAPMILSSGKKPAHLVTGEKVGTIYSYLQNKAFKKETFPDEMKVFSELYNCDVIIYNVKGNPLYGTKSKNPLTSFAYEELRTSPIYIFDSFAENKTYIIISMPETFYPYAYTGFLFDFIESSFSIRVIISFLIILIMMYPLAMYITKPLTELTQKAIKFSKGDFSDLDNKIKVKGNDEIAKLNIAFFSMANELVDMIEKQKNLISDMAHDIGSPLSRMQVAVDIIESQLDAGDMPPPKTVKKLSKNIREMAALAKEMLDLSRMEKAIVLNIEKTDVSSLVKDIVDGFHSFIEEKHLKVNIREEGALKELYLDKLKIERVIQNLLSNAIDYTVPDGHIEITVKGEHDHLTFSIKDEGPGIAEEYKDRIFDPFFRADSSRSRKLGGTGLGLAIVKKMVTIHGGKIRLENPGEKGAIITFSVLCKKPETVTSEQ